MATPEKIESVSKVDGASEPNANGFHEEVERVPPNKEHFQSLINAPNPNQTAVQRVEMGHSNESIEMHENNPIFQEMTSSQKSGSATDQERRGNRQSPDSIEEVGEVREKRSTSISSSDEPLSTQNNTISRSSLEDIQKEAKQALSQMESAKSQLSQIKEISPSYQNVMRNHLTHMDDHLRIAVSKLGGEQAFSESSASAEPKRVNPISRFIDQVTDTQKQMENVYGIIDRISTSGEKIDPSTMFLLQLKVHQVQEQMELFTNLLNKLLESTKTLMNVQV